MAVLAEDITSAHESWQPAGPEEQWSDSFYFGGGDGDIGHSAAEHTPAVNEVARNAITARLFIASPRRGPGGYSNRVAARDG